MLTQFTLMTTSSKPSPSSPTSATRPTSLDKRSNKPAGESLLLSSLTGAKRLAREIPAMEIFGLRLSTGFKKSVVMVPKTHLATTAKVVGLLRRGRLSLENSTMGEDLSNFHGTTTMEGFPISWLPAPTTAKNTS